MKMKAVKERLKGIIRLLDRRFCIHGTYRASYSKKLCDNGIIYTDKFVAVSFFFKK